MPHKHSQKNILRPFAVSVCRVLAYVLIDSGQTSRGPPGLKNEASVEVSKTVVATENNLPSCVIREVWISVLLNEILLQGKICVFAYRTPTVY